MTRIPVSATPYVRRLQWKKCCGGWLNNIRSALSRNPFNTRGRCTHASRSSTRLHASPRTNVVYTLFSSSFRYSSKRDVTSCADNTPLRIEIWIVVFVWMITALHSSLKPWATWRITEQPRSRRIKSAMYNAEYIRVYNNNNNKKKKNNNNNNNRNLYYRRYKKQQQQ